MTEDEVQVAVDRLADNLRRSVVVNDPGVHMLYTSAHFGDEDPVRVEAILRREAGAKAIGHVLAQGVSTWTTAGVIPADEEIGMRSRVCVPVRWQGDLLGMLMVMDADGSVTTAELAAITDTAQSLGPAMAIQQHDDESHDHRERLVHDLVGSEPSVRRGALEDLATETGLNGFDSVTAIEIGLQQEPSDVSGAHIEMALRSALTIRYPHPAAQLHAVSQNRALLLLGTTRPQPEQQLRAHASHLLARASDMAARRFIPVAGIGTAVAGLEHAHQTAHWAGLARRAASIGLLNSPVTADELGPYGPLLHIPAADLTPSTLPHELHRLLELDRNHQLVQTLRAYLDNAGQGPAAAQALHIHRTTLYYRLERITKRTGLDLSDGRTRLSLHLGLTMLDLINANFRHQEE